MVPEIAPDAEVEAGNRHCHLATPEIGVLLLADEGEGQGFSARARRRRQGWRRGGSPLQVPWQLRSYDYQILERKRCNGQSAPGQKLLSARFAVGLLFPNSGQASIIAKRPICARSRPLELGSIALIDGVDTTDEGSKELAIIGLARL